MKSITMYHIGCQMYSCFLGPVCRAFGCDHFWPVVKESGHTATEVFPELDMKVQK